MGKQMDLWSIRTLSAFKFVQEFELEPVMAFGNKLIAVDLPEPVYWVANNDNKAKS
jgi:hypothetical protein